ncbi:MAG: mechanosensitive ion channel [Solobacterium sp.]|nr:mechanosensitive ion channel [Solobacterium sp.]MBR2669142.1 mechanosensitive ion channel [Solobacterium sp.]
MEKMITMASISTIITTVCVNLVKALLVYLVGKWIIGKLISMLEKSAGFGKMDPTVRKFALSLIKIVFYVLIVITIINILGVPMASVVTVLASAGVAIGMAMQGSLSNLAGGIMLMIFRPFKAGDYVQAAGNEGVVKEIQPFYTVLTTVDNRTITIPNGSLMNSNVVNFSQEENRRVDLTFSCAKGEDIEKVCGIMKDVMNAHAKVLQDPAPFARLSGGTSDSMQFTVRAWTKSADYWDVFFDLSESITAALGAAGVQAPAVRVITETK